MEHEQNNDECECDDCLEHSELPQRDQDYWDYVNTEVAALKNNNDY